MNPLSRLAGKLADLLHPDADLTAAAHGLTVTYTPDGTRIVRHPNLPAIAAAYRARTLANPDPLDRLFADPSVIAQAHRDAIIRGARSGVTR
jgi:hypothetical protein